MSKERAISYLFDYRESRKLGIKRTVGMGFETLRTNFLSMEVESVVGSTRDDVQKYVWVYYILI